jgi:hypothetical protein
MPVPLKRMCSCPKRSLDHALGTLFPAGIPQRADWVSDQSSPTWLRRVHRCERGRLARGEVPSLNEARERRRRHTTQSAGKPRTRGKDARGLTFSRSNSCFVPDEVRVDRLPGGGRGAAVNANEMTSPVVTLGAEVANPWRARCPQRGMPGSEEGVVETTQTGTAPCPILPRSDRRQSADFKTSLLKCRQPYPASARDGRSSSGCS